MPATGAMELSILIPGTARLPEIEEIPLGGPVVCCEDFYNFFLIFFFNLKVVENVGKTLSFADVPELYFAIYFSYL